MTQNVRLGMCFQYFGAAPHFGRCVCKHITVTFSERSTGHNELVGCSPCPLDLSSLNLFLFFGGGYIFVYKTPVESEFDPIARITCTATYIQLNPGAFDHV